MTLLMQHPDWTKTRICEELELSRSAHRRWQTFNKAWSVLHESESNLPRGSVEDGRVEAVDPVEPWESLDHEGDEDMDRST